MKLIIGGHGDKSSQAGRQREENLCSGVGPHLSISQLTEIRLEIKDKTFGSSGKRDSPHEEDGEHEVGEEGGEVDHLAQ